MLFNSLSFPFFLLAILTVHWALTRNSHRNLFLILASYIFYGWWDYRFLSLIIISSAVDYVCGIELGKSDDPRKRKLILVVSLAVNLGILGAFKYLGFFAESLDALFRAAGLKADWPTLNIILPVGISFYTFQTLSYTIDVYRKKCPPCREFSTFFLFVSFFPQLVAGPIEKAVYLLPQFETNRRFDEALAKKGMRYILWGYFLKTVVADNLGPLINAAYGDPASHTGAELLLATYYFAFQIYGDFAGYSYIALGVAALFSINLRQNFRYPYLSTSMADFWSRWHISLSSWFKEYLYIFALGGNRVSKTRHALNVIATFTVSGFWHGANWTFIVWGLLNGLFYSFLKPFKSTGPIALLANWVITFHLICVGWVFFRAESVAQGVQIIWRILTGAASLLDATAYAGKTGWLLLMTLVLAFEFVQRGEKEIIHIDWAMRPARLGVYAALIFLYFFVGNFNRVPFIYFQF